MEREEEGKEKGRERGREDSDAKLKDYVKSCRRGAIRALVTSPSAGATPLCSEGEVGEVAGPWGLKRKTNLLFHASMLSQSYMLWLISFLCYAGVLSPHVNCIAEVASTNM